MSLRTRLVLVVTAAVAAAVVLASLLVFFIVRNQLFGGVDQNLQGQASQISNVPDLLAFATPVGPKSYVLRTRIPALGNPFEVVDPKGNRYRPLVGFDRVA